jgi:integrase
LKRRIPHLEGESIRLFREAVRSEETWEKYERLFWRFSNWVKLSPDQFLAKAADAKWTEAKLIEYIALQKERARRKEISEGTVLNFKKPIKLFLDMNDVNISWKRVNRVLPSARRYAVDRAPTVEELRSLVRYPDIRVEVIALTMLSSGIRVGAWDWLRVGNIFPVNRDGNIITAKIVVYEGEPEEYVTFVTPEAYEAIQRYLQFRELHGEKITPSSPLMRDLFRTVDMKTRCKGDVNRVVRLKHSGVKHLIDRALWRTGIRTEKKRRHEFAVDHGFRKFFKTRTEQVMKPINVEWVMNHATGISDSYYRPTENELLEDYLKAVPLLTISEVEEVRRENLHLKSDFEDRLNRIEAALTQLISLKGLEVLSLAESRKQGMSQ